MIAGCMPGGAFYYRPSTAAGKTVKHRCEQTPSMVNFRIGPLPGHAWARKTKNGTLILLDLGSYYPSKDTPPRTWRSFHYASDRFAARDLTHNTTIDNLPYDERPKPSPRPRQNRISC